MRSAIHLLMLLFAACSSGVPEGEAQVKEGSPTGEAQARKAAKAKRIADDCEKRFSARLDGSHWEAPHCGALIVPHDQIMGRFIQMDGSAPEHGEVEGTSVRLVLPNPVADDTIYHGAGTFEETLARSKGVSRAAIPHLHLIRTSGGISHGYSSISLDARITRKHNGEKFMIEGTYTAKLKDDNGNGPDIMVTDGEFRGSWIRAVRITSASDIEQVIPPEDLRHDYGFAYRLCGKYPGTDRHVALITNIFVYDDDGKENLPLRKRIQEAFEAELSKLPTKPVRVLGTIGLPLISPYNNENYVPTVARERAYRMLQLKNDAPSDGGTREVIEMHFQ